MNQERTADLDREDTERFVKQVLGCQCPPEVFRHIEKTRGIQLENGGTLHSRINVGDRLLIYVAIAEGGASAREAVSQLVKAGRDERDRKGFNRFRLVVASDHPREIEGVAESTFNALAHGDEKAHLHVVEKNELSLLEGRDMASAQPRE
jgi:hypothetical protein